MYCSSCGLAVTQTLSYCNHCGAKLNNSKQRDITKLAGMSLENLIWAIAGIVLGGLGVIIGLISVMRFNNFSTEVIIAFTVLSFLIVLGAEGVFIWLLVRFMGDAREKSRASQLNEVDTKALGAAHTRAIAEPAPSIIEHTTRTLEPIYSERKSK